MSYFIYAVLLLTTMSIAASPKKLIINNISSSKGTVVVGFYKSEDSYLNFSDPVFTKSVKVSNSPTIEIELDKLPYGEYAVAGYHDLNGNQKLDFGGPYQAPLEPLLWGNDAIGGYGIPEYEQVLVSVNTESSPITLSFQ